MIASKDELYKHPLDDIQAFQFNDSVARVFPDMIRRSVPGYSTLIALIGVLAEKYVQANSHVYDLGCSLGAATLAIRHRLTQPGVTLFAVDNSEAMLSKCRQILESEESPYATDLILDDLRNMPIRQASFVVLNFTLQFLPIEDRSALLQKLYQNLLPGGVLILSEKIQFEDPDLQAWMTEQHHLFKQLQGYSRLEISQKRQALENVLIPETKRQHVQRLQEAGFSRIYPFFQGFNFISLFAQKNIQDVDAGRHD